MLSGEQKEGAVAVMLPDEDKGKARGTEDDRKVKTQEGRAGDGWESSFFLDKNVPYISEHHAPTQTRQMRAGQRQSHFKTSVSHGRHMGGALGGAG